MRKPTDYTVSSEYSAIPADIGAVMPLIGSAVARLQVKMQSQQTELSGRYGPYTLTEVAQVTDPATGETGHITTHDYGLGRELHCNCREFECGKPCVHVAAVEAIELAEAVPA